MGRMAMLVVLSMVLTLGIVSYNFNQSRNIAFQKVAAYEKYSTNRNIGHTSVNLALRALDRNDTNSLSATNLMSMSFSGGSATVKLSYPNWPLTDTIVLQSYSSYVGGSYESKVKLFRKPDPFPKLNAALGLYVPNVNFGIDGNSALIDGRDHNVDGSLAADSMSAGKSAVTVITPGDTNTVINNTPNPTKELKGTTPKVTVDTSQSAGTMAQWSQLYISAADYVYNGPAVITTPAPYPVTTWGDSTNPAITYLNATSGDIKVAGNLSGWGILVVQGDIEMAGTFTFHGLVLVVNTGSITKDTLAFSTGTPDIIGGVILAGPSGSEFKMKGNDLIAYSARALQKSMMINKLQYFSVFRWYETDRTIDSLVGGFSGMQREILRR